jgi:hypothetical protein
MQIQNPKIEAGQPVTVEFPRLSRWLDIFDEVFFDKTPAESND